MLFLGISAGIPILLIFSSLSIWLTKAGVNKSDVTYFSWAALGYSFKFIWAPLVDKLPIPVFTKMLGKRRSWLLLSQMSVVLAICIMGSINPVGSENALVYMAFAAVALGFSSATQDIVIDAYRIEALSKEYYPLMSSAFITGYRLGMIVSGAGALLLVSFFNTSEALYDYDAWKQAYYSMALVMFIGIVTTLIVKEPEHKISNYSYKTQDYLGLVGLFIVCVVVFILFYILSAPVCLELKSWLGLFFGNKELAIFIIELFRLVFGLSLGILAGGVLAKTPYINRKMIVETYFSPVIDFFQRYGKAAILLLLVIASYRMSDIVLGVISNVFYVDMHYSEKEIATVVKTFGLVMTISGGLIGGVMAVRFGVMRILFVGAILVTVTNLLFMLLANIDVDAPHELRIQMLYFVIGADNLAAGIASTAFVAFLSALTNVSFTAVQYAIFSSLMTFIPKVMGGYSGSMVEVWGYSTFFLVASLLGIPVLFLIWLARGLVQDK